METFGYFIFNATGRHLTKNLSYNKNGFWNHKKGYVFSEDQVKEIKNIFKDKKDKPIYKQPAVYEDLNGTCRSFGPIELLWLEDELNKEELFCIELKSLMNKYDVQIEEDFDWTEYGDGEEYQVSTGFWFVGKTKDDILIKINKNINNQ